MAHPTIIRWQVAGEPELYDSKADAQARVADLVKLDVTVGKPDVVKRTFAIVWDIEAFYIEGPDAEVPAADRAREVCRMNLEEDQAAEEIVGLEAQVAGPDWRGPRQAFESRRVEREIVEQKG